MSRKSARYLTTTLPYVNAAPHIGHALEYIIGDVLTRYWRLMGHEVFFNIGVDEHGQKIAEQADAAGQDRQEYVDYYAGEFQKLITALNLAPDNFIRTTDPVHQQAAQEIWRRSTAAGDIYKKAYTGRYCVGCEMFYQDDELLTDFVCPIHLKVCEEVAEENYFFRLSKYQDYLIDYLSNEVATVPDWRRLELLTFVQKGLEDISISRDKSRLDWGIPVPDDEDQVMYVWFDALTNYISTLGWPDDQEGKYQQFWVEGETVQIAGKDQLRFQSILWQAMLKSAGLPATDKIIYHGFINSGGHKMSKSLGNVIAPYDLVGRYGTEATRYLLLRHVHPFDDSDITWEKLDEWYTAGLVNGLGNLVSRVLKMSETYLELEDFPPLDPTTLDLPETYNLQQVLDHIWALIGNADAIIAETEPFKLIKTDPEVAKDILRDLREDVLHIGRLLLPFMPETSAVIRQAVRANQKPENLFSRLG